ncbi:TPA_exp: Uncharacterized protein A8136_4735 [Trichophyton benhamiae CBS 112371]|uniref:Uncharacterized protein n=1 Tax=Arthroderma benhamiae (strain ATCC MYA-4681 / CBS 112371) TaxID=663331 RepID=D4B343_ARTBC|nr:uncharacterized protein ARB_02877 [Trichophyton benhamiae CBS 112371]EFE30198.1 hypothetical protein ARB_02877 [Trichophyton benhamiae CBS 112371]DAA73425.1 TPA_exp: Uncharacterized protein A8136_4735 [Trichophyton benhamiae CBS 112371]
MGFENPLLLPLVRSAYVKFYLSKQRGVPIEPDIFTCRACDADYQVEVRALDRDRLALVTTKWTNLGAGLDPEDIRWKKNNEKQRAVDLEPVKSSSKENVSLFEDAEGPPLASLTDKNESYLLNNNYRYSLGHLWPGVWMTLGGKHLQWYHFFYYFCYKEVGMIVKFYVDPPLWTGTIVLYLAVYYCNLLGLF